MSPPPSIRPPPHPPTAAAVVCLSSSPPANVAIFNFTFFGCPIFHTFKLAFPNITGLFRSREKKTHPISEIPANSSLIFVTVDQIYWRGAVIGKKHSDVVRKYRLEQVLPAHVWCLIELWPFTWYHLYLMPHYLLSSPPVILFYCTDVSKM